MPSTSLLEEWFWNFSMHKNDKKDIVIVSA